MPTGIATPSSVTRISVPHSTGCDAGRDWLRSKARSTAMGSADESAAASITFVVPTSEPLPRPPGSRVSSRFPFAQESRPAAGEVSWALSRPSG